MQAAEQPPVLELRDARIVRDGRHILDGVSLVVHRGEHTAIVGPNGSGKSSLIGLLTHDHYPLPPANGEPPVCVFGRARWNVVELRRRMGIVSADLQQRFAHGTSVGHLRGQDAVVSGFFASQVLFFHHEVTPAMRERARRALARLGGERLAEQSLATMSTGEVRRVLIARALVTDPELLVLDEPTSGLDLVARRGFLALLGSLAEQDLTILLITHQVEEILPQIGRVVLLADGKVAHDGPKREALTSAALSGVFGSSVVLRERGGHYALELAER